MHLRLPVRRFVVADTSMAPALQPGDRVLVGTWLPRGPGDIVVLRDPEWRSTFVAKRLARVESNGDLVVLGDNPNVSRDSRAFGAVPRELVVGKVFWRYLPAGRRGWVR